MGSLVNINLTQMTRSPDHQMPRSDHSYLSATMGSTFIARRAGM